MKNMAKKIYFPFPTLFFVTILPIFALSLSPSPFFDKRTVNQNSV